MATMEKQKKSRTSSTTSFQNEQRQHSTTQQSNPDESAIQQLMLEPLDYNESLVTVGTEPPSLITAVSATKQSLRNLNNVCLTGLDGVLRYILIHDAVSSLSQRQQQQRTDTHTNLISSIRYSTQCLARASATMMNSNENSNIHNNHHNLTTLLSQVENLLDQHLWLITSHSDLCRVLLQMINTITRNNDTNESFLDDAGHLMKTTTSSNNLLQHVRSEIRQTLASLPTQLTFSNKEVEAEFYQHLKSLSRLVNHTDDYHYIDEIPPAYQDVTTDVTLPSMIKEEKLPQYFEQEQKVPHSYSELDAVFNAIDRLSHVTPRFNNQRVERQLRIEETHPAPKMLCDSIAQIQRMSRFKLVKRSNSAPSSSNTSTGNNDTNSTTQRRVSASTIRSDQVRRI
ncbi:hypothetical protein BDC45DRAFT_191349 [Circinella umbellata]|nr:hypothetical protein BDC45DRAFT_191349 [Circinella umbellata]